VSGTLWRRFARALTGGPVAVHTEDRRVLEGVIFPHYAHLADVRAVLFVGCESYTQHYGRHFPAHDYWTIDADPVRRRFGAKRHVVGRLEQLHEYFPAARFDLIVCNGVYGWGLDRLEDCESALNACRTCLADQGHMVFGWNDIPERDPAPLTSIAAFARFSEYALPGLGSRYLTETDYRHTYRFLQKTRPRV
jgi:hypothetical protein